MDVAPSRSEIGGGNLPPHDLNFTSACLQMEVWNRIVFKHESARVQYPVHDQGNCEGRDYGWSGSKFQRVVLFMEIARSNARLATDALALSCPQRQPTCGPTKTGFLLSNKWSSRSRVDEERRGAATQ